MAEALEGRCTACNLTLRPQLSQDLKKGEEILSCESCQRILYYNPPVAAEDLAGEPAPADHEENGQGVGLFPARIVLPHFVVAAVNVLPVLQTPGLDVMQQSLDLGLRGKLADSTATIETVRGFGYRIVPG